MRIPNIDFVITHIETTDLFLNDINIFDSDYVISNILSLSEICTPTTHRRPIIKTISISASQISVSTTASQISVSTTIYAG